MNTQLIETTSGTAQGYVLPAGSFNIVCVTCAHGLVGCAVFSTEVLQKLNHAAALVRGVASVDDLLAASVFAINEAAAEKGLYVGMSGRDAVEALS